MPAAIDVLSHEHDLRGALGAAGARDDESIEIVATLLARGLRASRPLSVDVFRLRMGRRSRAQVRAMPWSSDPSNVLDDLFIFGPAPRRTHCSPIPDVEVLSRLVARSAGIHQGFPAGDPRMEEQ